MSSARRNLLGGVVALAAAPMPALAMPAADAEAMRLAQEVIGAEAAYAASFTPRAGTVEEEAARDPERDRLLSSASDQAEALAQLPITTLAGVLAKARAALAVADKDSTDGAIVAKDYVEWLAYAAFEDLVRVMESQA